MIKAVFFDIDGTLTSLRTGKIPQSTYKALEQLHQKGIKRFIATGRHIIDVDLTPVRDISFDGYVTLNGQICLDGSRKSFYDNPVDSEDAEYMVDLFEKKELIIVIAEMNRKYINYLTEEDLKLQKMNLIPKTDVGTYKGEKIYQFMLHSNIEIAKEIASQLKKCKATHWPPDGTDIIPSYGGKVIGIQKTLEHYGIRQEETMAFGDGDNDKEMISFAQIGVAMGNAEDDVRQCADYVTTDVEEDGIMKALQHFHVL
ncbi:MAG: Cof-type HAD-IIB family hydrolase [Lachnospiraceae bacterium]|nr:Cof-type HAD-IIB family hydrolase [Lachnospiraceae bacterium]